MEKDEFRRIATQTLLGQPAFIEEFIKLAASMKESISSDRKLLRSSVACMNNHPFFSILFKFNEAESVAFHRRYLAEPLGKLYREISDLEDAQSIHQNATDAIKEFLALDIFLSPITSFPRNHPVELLFAEPFERLYNDVYIYGDSDYAKMAQRAYLIYSKFSEILRFGILLTRNREERWEKISKFTSKTDEDFQDKKKSNFMRRLRKDLFYSKQNLTNLIKELIFYWNIASLRLDFIYCRQKHRKDKGYALNGAYHLLRDSEGILAKCISEKRMSFKEMTSEDMIITSLWCGESDPFSNMRYCYCFKDLNLEERHVSAEEIASALEDI